MIEFEGAMLAPVGAIPSELLATAILSEGAVLEGAMLQAASTGDLVMQEEPADEWILETVSSASSESAPGGVMVAADDHGLDLQPIASDEVEITITGKRFYDDTYYPDGGGTGGGGTGDSGGAGEGGSTGGGGSGATAVEQHQQDCGTEDGAAVQVARHVMGLLPAGVSGPEDRVTTASGNDWTKVEFGAVIVRNPDGTYGALNNMIYSDDQPRGSTLPNSVGQPIQGIWHNHSRHSDPGQRLIDRYPSPGDWATLEFIAGQVGATSDPSIWLTGPDGVTREFKLSEKDWFESLGEEQMKDDEGLDGRERSQSCG